MDSPAHEQKEEKKPMGGTETILLVDDEYPFLDFGKKLFSESGYEVITAVDGESAIEIYREKNKRINIIILDLVMPGIGGARCLEEILHINSQAKIVLISGYAPWSTDKLSQVGAKRFISKPFNVEQILNIVRNVLDEN